MNKRTETPSIPATMFALPLTLTWDTTVKSNFMLKAICLNLALAQEVASFFATASVFAAMMKSF